MPLNYSGRVLRKVSELIIVICRPNEIENVESESGKSQGSIGIKWSILWDGIPLLYILAIVYKIVAAPKECPINVTRPTLMTFYSNSLVNSDPSISQR